MRPSASWLCSASSSARYPERSATTWTSSPGAMVVMRRRSSSRSVASCSAPRRAFPDSPGVFGSAEGVGEAHVLELRPRRRGGRPSRHRCPALACSPPDGPRPRRRDWPRRTQVGQDVLDLPAVRRSGCPDHLCRARPLPPAPVRSTGLGVGPVEDGPRRRTRSLGPAQPDDLGGYPGRLIALVLGPVAVDRVPGLAFGEEALGRPGPCCSRSPRSPRRGWSGWSG